MARRKSRKRKSLVPEWLDDILPRGSGFDQMMRGAGGVETDPSKVPYIAGVTRTSSGNFIPGGYERWLSKTPEQRYQESALGQSESFSMEGPSPGRAVLSDMAQGNSYWAGLARNIAYGKELPKANLPDMDAFEGQRWSDPGSTSPLGESAERVGGAHVGPNTPEREPLPTQRQLNWPEMSRELQQEIYEASQKSGRPVSEILSMYYAAGGTGRG